MPSAVQPFYSLQVHYIGHNGTTFQYLPKWPLKQANISITVLDKTYIILKMRSQANRVPGQCRNVVTKKKNSTIKFKAALCVTFYLPNAWQREENIHTSTQSSIVGSNLKLTSCYSLITTIPYHLANLGCQ